MFGTFSVRVETSNTEAGASVNSTFDVLLLIRIAPCERQQSFHQSQPPLLDFLVMLHRFRITRILSQIAEEDNSCRRIVEGCYEC